MKGKLNKISSALALVFAAGVIAAPTAFAVPVEQMLPGHPPAESQEVEQPYMDAISRPTTPAPEPSPGSPSPSSPSTFADGFDWGDAGIGAATMLALAAIAGGIALVTRPHNRQTVA